MISQATANEVLASGWTIDGDQAQSPVTGAWYSLNDFRVHDSRTNDAGLREFGEFLSLDSDAPAAERFCVPLTYRERFSNDVAAPSHWFTPEDVSSTTFSVNADKAPADITTQRDSRHTVAAVYDERQRVYFFLDAEGQQ